MNRILIATLFMSQLSFAQDSLKYKSFQTNLFLLPDYYNFNFDFEIGDKQTRFSSNVFSLGYHRIGQITQEIDRTNFYVGFQKRFYFNELNKKGLNASLGPYSKLLFRIVEDYGDEGEYFTIIPAQEFSSLSIVFGGNFSLKYQFKKVNIELVLGPGLGIPFLSIGDKPFPIHVTANSHIQLGIRL